MRRVLSLVAVAAVASAAAACSSSSSSGGSTGSANANAPVTLTVGLFGSFGYKEAGLYDAYMKLHPNVKIVETSPQNETDYWNALQTHLAGGSGLDDIQAIEVGRIASVTAKQADKFVDLDTLPGGPQVVSQFLPWKMALAKTASGAQLAVGTDIGPLSMCYQPALFKAAGLPSDAASVGKLWSSWSDYVNVGKQFMAKAPAGTAWTDSAGGLFRAAMGGNGDKYTDASGNLIWNTSPAVQTAWNLTMTAVQNKETAALTEFSPEWNQTFNSSKFATIACPAWMLTYIKGQAGTAGSGRWAVATPPATGNVGGSYLAITKASKHKDAAWSLLQFLTSADSQEAVFEKAGSFPSNTGAIDKIKTYVDPYFNNSPVGQIFAASAASLPTQVVGPHDDDIETALMNAANEVAQKGTSPTSAWGSAKTAIDAAVG